MAPRALDPCQETVGYFIKPTTAPARSIKSITHLHVPRFVEKQRTGTPTMKRIFKKDEEFTGGIGMKVAAFYRREYPKNTAKRLAAEAGVAVVTAKGWLSGKCPATAHLMSMWARRGRTFFAFVFDDIDADLAAIAAHKAEVEEIEKRIRGLHEALRENGHSTRD